ncbi:MAG TPA: T9SS type B sorting domain-containing protein, partial [Chitinophagaceae bacterium]|nr:T9SS type B sorting domain-containing protein [Chitinophagaceae bacterium]
AGPYTFTGLAPGNYTVTIADNWGCLTASPISATIGQGAGVNTTQSQTPTTCLGANNGTITVTPTNGTGPYTYVLDGTVTQTAPGAYTFGGVSSGSHTITVTDFNGCTRSPALIINVGAGGTLSATPNLTATSCSGASNGTATITPTNGTGPYSFNLDNGAVIQTGATSTTFTNLTAGNHTVVITDASNCQSNPMTITINAGPALSTTATHSNVLCNGGSTGTITVTQPAAGTAPYEYSLDGIAWQSSNVFPGLAAGTYTVRYRESNGCSGQLTEVVAEPAVLSATQATVAVVCNGQSNGTITITPNGGQSPYQYSLDATNWQASNVFNVPAGSYTVTIRDFNNCTTTQNMTVTEPNALTGSATTTNATCNGGNDGVITVTANGGNGNYQYSINAGANYEAANTFNVAPGTYTVRIKDALGCTFDVSNVVVGLTNDLTFTDPADPTICEGTSTQLQVVSNAIQYSWTPSTGVSNASVSNPTVNPTTTTDYTVTVTLGRCTADIPIRVNVNAAPIPDAGAQGFICYGQTYQLQGSGGTQFTWTPSTYLDNPNIANPISTPDKTITYTLSVKDANDCASLVTDQVVIDVTPPIKVTTYPFDTVAYDGDQFQILATSGATDYLWSPAIGLSDPTIPNPIVTTGAIGDVAVYKVVASTIAGCKGEGYVTVRVYKGPDFYVPTGFTPNGDGRNDTFYPFPVGIKEIKYFRVFNRWGQLVFQTTRLNEGWNGKLGGKDQNNDVYVWQVQGVTKDNRVITKKGTVVLIR